MKEFWQVLTTLLKLFFIALVSIEYNQFRSILQRRGSRERIRHLRSVSVVIKFLLWGQKPDFLKKVGFLAVIVEFWGLRLLDSFINYRHLQPLAQFSKYPFRFGFAIGKKSIFSSSRSNSDFFNCTYFFRAFLPNYWIHLELFNSLNNRW